MSDSLRLVEHGHPVPIHLVRMDLNRFHRNLLFFVETWQYSEGYRGPYDIIRKETRL